jgi:electron transport complex protein RnfD
MGDVLVALAPAFAVSVWMFGVSALLVTAVAVASCVLFEAAIQKWMLRRSETLLPAVLTGVLLAFNLPSSIPLWLVVVGSLVAIGIAKMSFGGLGKNLFNPALVGRVFLLVAYPVQMTSFPAVDASTGATPLAMVKGALRSGQSVSDIMPNLNYLDMSIGQMSGSLGEVAAIALLLGGVYMLVRKTITWHIPVAVLGSMALMTGVMYVANPQAYMDPVFHLLSGGAILGAVYMATDYVTSPMTTRGKIVFGVGVGVITVVIRVWGAYPEGMSFAILLMNACVPLIDKGFRPRRFGKKNSK